MTDYGVNCNIGTLDAIKSNCNRPPDVDLILAVPRPLRLERILPVVSCMGVRRLFLVGAEKVEKDYFGWSKYVIYPTVLV